MSSFIEKNCDDGKDLDYAKCRPEDSLIELTLLSCGQGGNATFVGPDNPSAVIGKVLVDGREIHKPTVSIQFSSIVSLLFTDDGLDPNPDGAEVRLRFGLFRVNHPKSPELLNSWIYEVFRIEDLRPGIRLIDSFSFNYCDSLLASSGCCEYFIEVSVENLLTVNVVVNNVHITALA